MTRGISGSVNLVTKWLPRVSLDTKSIHLVSRSERSRNPRRKWKYYESNETRRINHGLKRVEKGEQVPGEPVEA